MAFLAPLAATGAGAAGTAAALGTGAAAAGAGTALGAGLSAGTILGTGAASSGLLGSLGLNALGGMASTLPASAGLMAATPAALTSGAAALAPTAGIFSKAMPALAGLPSTFTGPGLLNTMGMSPLGGIASMVPAGTSLPGAAGFKSLAMANAPLYGGEAFKSLSMANAPLYGGEAAKLTNLGFKSAQLPSNFIKTAADVGTKTGVSPNYLVQGAGPSVPSLEVRQLADLSSGLTKGGLKMPTPGVETTGLRLSPEAAQSVMVPRGSPIIKGDNFLSNFGNLLQNPSMDAAGDYIKEHPYATAGAAYGLYNLMKPKDKAPEKEKALIRPYEFERTQQPEAYAVSPISDTSERTYFTDTFTPLEPYEAPGPEYKRASGGITSLAVGGPVEQMAAMNAVGANTGYPMAGINTAMYSNPMMQRPEAVNVISPSGDAGVTAYSGEPKFASGGLSDLGGYSDGGRLLRGPGDGVSDSIPAVIGDKQPARLADGEFVIPARIVSELGNGSTEAGARKLYAMMDRVQKARRKTVGKDRVAANTRADKHLPA